MTLLNDIGLWLWRLLPGNPILVRVVAAGGKRVRHLHARWIYLVVLFLVMLVVGGGGALSAGANSLAELAKKSTNTFMWVSFVQLFLMSFIAPVFMAGAITQEKDANTFHILLTTPLSTGQIVLGSLMSRLYFVWALLLSGLPIFCITMMYGGVTLAEVFLSFGLAACTGMVTGALAIMISFIKVGTRRTIFSFFLGVAAYLLIVGVYGLSPYGWLAAAPAGFGGEKMSWLAPIHPFLALLVVTGRTPAPAFSDVFNTGWPWRYLLAYPAVGYMVVTTIASVGMVLVSIFFVRQSQKEGELTLWNRLAGFFAHKDPAAEQTRPPRRVWRNPIAWREAKTRASAAGRSLMRWAFVICGIAGAIVLLVAHENGWWSLNPSRPALTRDWLTAVTWIELAIMLLIITNAAATSLTREKESASMELLLTTQLTSKYIAAGILRGLVSFALPLVAVPTVTLLLFVIADLRRSPGMAVTTPETVLFVPLLATTSCALAAMVGLQFSLISKKTVQAVMISTAVVMVGSGLLWGCVSAVSANSGGSIAADLMGAILRPLTPFTGLQVLIDYRVVFTGASVAPSPRALESARVVRVVSSAIGVVLYAVLTYLLYTNFVRNFDMTVRRQSA